MGGRTIAPPPPSSRERLVWALLLAGAVLAPFQGRFGAPGRTASVEFTMTAERPGTVELYLDSGRGFNEAEVSRGTFLAGQPCRVRLPIPQGTYRRLRLDPSVTSDTVSIGDFVMLVPGTAERVEVDVSRFRPAHAIADARIDDGRLVVTTSGHDSYLVLEPPGPIRLGRSDRPWAVLAMTAAFAALAAAVAVAWRASSAALPRLPASGRVAACLAVACVVLLLPRLPWIDAPLLDWFSFRQTQTALTAHWFVAEGLSLPAYPLPILGRPWTAPLEFPAFQMAAAGVHWLGVPLDAACRGVALAAFAACFGVLAWFLRRHRCPDVVLVALWLFALATPFALVWSKAALIEFFAVLCGLAYVGLACEIHARGPRPALVAAITAAGVGAAMIKITTFAVFLPACGLLAAHDLWRRRARGAGRLAIAVLAWAAAVAVPVLAGQVWTEVADAIKASCPTTEWLVSSRLRTWNFGTLAQRLEPRNWHVIGRRIRHDVLPFLWPLALYGIVMLARLPTRVALASLGMLVGSVGAVATFFNLYLVHDYYLCAVAFPLWLAAAAGLHGLTGRLALDGAARRLALPATLGILVVATFRSHQVAGSCADFTDHEIIRFTREVQRLVPPGDEVVIVGEEYNPRLPYYARRKALMVTHFIKDHAFIVDYATREGIRYAITAPAGKELVRRLFPAAEEIMRSESFELHQLRGAR